MVLCQPIEEKVIVTPELIFEVVSTSSTKRDEIMKFDLYQREGVQNYVLVYPEKRLAKVYRNHSQGFKKMGDVCADSIEFDINQCKFKIDFASIWR